MSNFNANEKFNRVILINSNIRNNKKTIIGNFDIKDLLFILLGILVGIMSMTILFFILKINSIFICIIIIAIVEVPIITIGFKKVNDIPYIDYIMMNQKSNNSNNRSLKKRKNVTKEKYILSYKLVNYKEDKISFIERKIKEIRDIFNTCVIQIKIGSFGLYMTICIDHDSDVDYKKFIYSSIKDNELNGLGVEDINDYNNKIYGTLIYKAQVNDKNRSNKINEKKYLAVYKIKIYKEPFDNKFIEEIVSFSEITKYYYEGENNNLNIYIVLIGNEEEIRNKTIELEAVSDKYKVLLSEIIEEKVKNTISLYMENIY